MTDAVRLIAPRADKCADGVRLIAPPTVNKRLDLQLSGVVTKLMPSGKRRVRGVASTDALDRQGDIVEPRGGSWSLPVPLLKQHDHSAPVGWVQSIEVSGNSLAIEAEFAEGVGQADEVWELVEAGLISAYSIGFRSIKSEQLPGGGLRFVEWELLEVSVVTVPANPGARIQRAAQPHRHEAIPLYWR